MRCCGARQLKDDPGIRPFLEPEKSWDHDGYGSRYFEDAYDRQDVCRVSQACNNLGYKRTNNNTSPPVRHVYYAPEQSFERDEGCRYPVRYRFSVHFGRPFARDSSNSRSD